MQKKTPYIIVINRFACHNCDFFLRCSFKPRCVSELVCSGPPLMGETAFLHLLPSVGSLSGCGYSCSAVLRWVFNSEPRYSKGVDNHQLRLFKSNKSCRLISSRSHVISCCNIICVLETSRLWTINCFVSVWWCVRDEMFADAIQAYSGGDLTVTGPTATAGIFSTYPADYLSVWGGIVDQVSPCCSY